MEFATKYVYIATLSSEKETFENGTNYAFHKVATYLRRGGNFVLFLRVREFKKSVNTQVSYCQKQSATFLWDAVHIVCLYSNNDIVTLITTIAMQLTYAFHTSSSC